MKSTVREGSIKLVSTTKGATSKSQLNNVKAAAMSGEEERFVAALADIFVGVQVEGVSGYINLMTIKTKYLNRILGILRKDIEEKTAEFPEFRKELFEKLYAFFKRYFNPTGSLYFASTPFSEQVYERVYTDKDDVSLFWKTHMLYYVKTERLLQNMKIEVNGSRFFFDVSKIEHKKAWEKKDLVYGLAEAEKHQIIFKVCYSESGRKTNIEEILRDLKKEHPGVGEATLRKAFATFEKQSEVDYFINKNARAFLGEQFDLWFYRYLFSDISEFSANRVTQLKVLKEIAYSIIAYIGQFEDELVRIWNKPKFSMRSNYVVTFDRLAERPEGIELVQKIISHSNFSAQVDEWRQYGIVGAGFNFKEILSKKQLNANYKFLPIDTKHFKNLELEIIGIFSNLDQSLDGWLIKSENYQALNTILPKFKGKVQSIYIDPPFNKEQDADYFYSVKFKDSTWITMLENRLRLAKELLSDAGSIFVRCDYNGNMFVRLLMNDIFDENLLNEIVVKRGKIQFGESNRYTVATDSLCWYSKTGNYFFSKFRRPRYEGEPTGSNMILRGERHPRERKFLDEGQKPHVLLPPPNAHFKFVQDTVDEMTAKRVIELRKSKKGLESGYMELVHGKWKKTDLVPYYIFDVEKAVDSNWTDISGYSQDWSFPTENSEKLLQRAIESSSREGDLVMDFFLGSSTTTAVAHKLRRKWIGVEMGHYFDGYKSDQGVYTGILVRMKEVLAGAGNHEPCGISKEVKWEGGGFFKYYELEQYENALSRTRYEDSDPFFPMGEDPYNQYVFLKDRKLIEALEIDYEKNKVHVNLSKLYPDIDVAETLSNLTGNWIRRISETFVEFADGATIDISNPDYRLVKPLIWW
jgi:adenine specific DNA methylase Mod